MQEIASKLYVQFEMLTLVNELVLTQEAGLLHLPQLWKGVWGRY